MGGGGGRYIPEISTRKEWKVKTRPYHCSSCFLQKRKETRGLDVGHTELFLPGGKQIPLKFYFLLSTLNSHLPNFFRAMCILTYRACKVIALTLQLVGPHQRKSFLLMLSGRKTHFQNSPAMYMEGSGPK